jgi:PAS domain S-box-containing protein
MAKKYTYKELEKKIQELGQVASEHERTKEALQDSQFRFQLLYERVPLAYQSLDENGNCIEVNPSWLSTLGYTREEVIGKSFGDFLHPEWKEHFKENFLRFKAVGEILGVEFKMVKKDGSLILVSFHGKVGKNKFGDFQQTHCIFQDITEHKRVEEALKESHETLEEKVKERTADLKDMNVALKILLKKREEDKMETEEKIITNYKSLVSPFLQKLKMSLTKKEQQNLMDILESNLKEFLQPFSQKLSNPVVNLTPTEIQIASMVKQGLSNKEIAQALNNSIRTITSHRNHIRKKLGLNNKKVNLRSYLSTL